MSVISDLMLKQSIEIRKRRDALARELKEVKRKSFLERLAEQKRVKKLLEKYKREEENGFDESVILKGGTRTVLDRLERKRKGSNRKRLLKLSELRD